jgi:hypothetical protein
MHSGCMGYNLGMLSMLLAIVLCQAAPASLAAVVDASPWGSAYVNPAGNVCELLTVSFQDADGSTVVQYLPECYTADGLAALPSVPGWPEWLAQNAPTPEAICCDTICP